MRCGLLVLALLLHLVAFPLVAQCPDGTAPPCERLAQRTPRAEIVAVLYFENLSADTANLYLAYGLTEELIDRLARIDRLSLRSRTAVQRFRGRALDDPAALGRALAVNYLVSGSVRREGDRLRVSAELTRVPQGVRVWGEIYDRSANDLLGVQAEIAKAIASGVAGRLAPGDARTLTLAPTRNAAAYDHFLRGNFLLAQRTKPAFAGALREYEAALRLDTAFSRAASRLAYAHALALAWVFPVTGVQRDSILLRGLQLATNVIERESENSDAWMARGYLLKFSNPYSYAGAKEALYKAVILDERNAEAWHQYGSVLYDLGEDSASARAFRRALAIEPDREITLLEASFLPTIARRWSEAIRLLDSAVRVAPASLNAREYLARARLMSGDTVGARRDAEIARQMRPLSDSDPWPQLFAATVLGGSGDTAAIRFYRSWLVALLDTADITQWQAAYLVNDFVPALLATGERERALRLLEAIEPRNPALGFALRWPSCDDLRNEPRFIRLLEETRPR